jgi:hypothetical protein
VPKILEWNGYRFFFFSNEGDPREPRHIHVRKGERSAKFFLDPAVTLASSYDLRSSELNELESVVEMNVELFRRNWDEYFGF